MPKFQPKTSKQLRAIFGLAKPLNCDEDSLRELAAEVSNNRIARLSLLSFAEANALIKRLGGEPFSFGGTTPRRTVNYQKQQAGIPTIETRRHLNLMDDLANKRGMSAEGLQKLCRRMLKGKSRPTTTSEGNKIIEALKAMNRRDYLNQTSPNPQSEIQNPKSRRAA